jgi:hypothetical protein
MMLRLAFSVVVGLPCLSGCAQTRIEVQRAQSGTVLDGATGTPLAKARVTVEVWTTLAPGGQRGDRKTSFEVAADAKGQFEIPEAKEWGLLIPIPDCGTHYNQRLCFRAPGFQTKSWDPWANSHSWGYRFPNEFKLEPLSSDEKVEPCFPD